MSALGPGDWVECLEDDFVDPEPGMIPAFAGRVYRVLCIDYQPGICQVCQERGPGIYLDGDRPNPDWGRCRCTYRPIYREKADFLTSLLTPVDGAKPRVTA